MCWSRTRAARQRAISRRTRVGGVGALAVNLTLRSAVELTRAVLPGMRERKWGRIINVTSITVKQPVDNLILSNRRAIGSDRIRADARQ